MVTPVEHRPQVEGGLRRGVNLSHWYSQVYGQDGYSVAHFDRYLGDADFELIARLGFDHVRFPISWEWLFEDRSTTPARVARIVNEVVRLQAAGLTVIVDSHPEMAFKAALREDDAVTAFVASWRDLAAALADLPANRTAIELLNEPSLRNAERWHRIARESLAAVRSATDDHTVIVSGDGYSELPQLLEIPVIDDPLVLYNFHMYDPMIVSHQSAYFADEWVKAISNLAYPTDTANADAVLAGDLPDRSRHELEAYRASPWSRDRYDVHLAPAIAFANERGVALTCNEFGIYRDAPRTSRIAWLGDVSHALSGSGIGWTVWDYAGDFAVATGVPGRRHGDDDLTTALGLRDP